MKWVTFRAAAQAIRDFYRNTWFSTEQLRRARRDGRINEYCKRNTKTNRVEWLVEIDGLFQAIENKAVSIPHLLPKCDWDKEYLEEWNRVKAIEEAAKRVPTVESKTEYRATFRCGNLMAEAVFPTMDDFAQFIKMIQ